MQQALAASAAWVSDAHRLRKFRLHRAELRVTDLAAYDRSARDTIAVGVRFMYRDHDSRGERVGYFDRARRRFTALSADESRIINHFCATANYVRHLPESDYP